MKTLTEQEYDDAVDRIYEMMQSDIVPGSSEETEFIELCASVYAYDEFHFAIPPSSKTAAGVVNDRFFNAHHENTTDKI